MVKTTVKMKNTISQILLSTTAVLAPIQPAMIAIGVLIAIDLVMGIIAAYKSGEKIQSKKLKFTAVKLLIYNLLLISGFVAETFLAPWIPFTKIALGFLATVEITSIGESFQAISGLSFLRYVKHFINEKLNKTPGVNKKDKK